MRSHQTLKLFSVLHSLHVLSLFFLALYTFIVISHSYCRSHPPTDCFTAFSPLTPTIPHSSICQSLDCVHGSLLYRIIAKRQRLLSSPTVHSFTLSLLLILSGDIHLNPGPNSTTLQFAHLNICSAASITATLDKPTVLKEFLADQNLEILSLSETWLSPDTLPSTLNSLTPPNFSIIHSPRPMGRGGGVAFIYRSYLNMTRITLPSFTSFEYLCIKLSICSSSFTFLTIYRPPSSSISSFIAEFATLLDELNISPSELIITGDFNIHVDNHAHAYVQTFLDTLDSHHLTQHVHFPTHKHGHTLDLLITRSTSDIISTPDYTIPFISDHYAIHTVITVPIQTRSPRITKITRCFKSIDIPAFCIDILASDLHTTIPTSLPEYLTLFDSTLTNLLDKHAPLKSVSCPAKPQKPYITPAIKAQKTIRSRLESVFRQTRSMINHLNFKKQSQNLSKLISAARRDYFRSLISQHQANPRQLWSTLNSLLSRKLPQSLPTGFTPAELTLSFLKFFNDKIATLSANLSTTTTQSPHIVPRVTPPVLDSFSCATLDEVKTAILASSDATCQLDIIPTKLLKSCLHALLQPLTNIINLSLTAGIFPTQFKHALVSPHLKKYNLPKEDLSSYRPVSNLNFISKILERIIHTRLTKHTDTFPSVTSFQSAYRHLHSTETALIRIQNDLLSASNEQKVTALVLLDLSAAFDTIDHQILITRLSSFYGITGSALNLLSSYLLNRTQSVCIGSSATPSSLLFTGVPQGSVLGPLLFTLYTSPLSHIFNDSPVAFHLYADDTQLYISFSASDSQPSLTTLSSKLDTLHAWLTCNRLTVNPAKTEYLIIGTPQQRSKLLSSTISFQNLPITPTTSARNLGVIFDLDLSYKKQITSVCQTSYLYIRQLRQIRSTLDTNSAILLANALVSSRLDYCNSLYYGLPDTSINRLQRVQNSLARVVLPSFKRHDHITPALQKLHWLPVKDRITFKIATLTFKTLHYQQPLYLLDLISRHKPSRALRSSSQQLLNIPLTKSEIGRRSFSFAAPTIWNSLPPALRSMSSIITFRSALKTHLFPKFPT